MSRSERGVAPTFVTGSVILLGWLLISLVTARIPGPVPTLKLLGQMIADGTATTILGRTALFMGVCFSIAAVAGVAVGLFIGTRPALDRGVSPYLAALLAMPTSLWIPVAAIVIGASVWSLGTVVALGAMPAVILGTRTAVKNVPPLLLRAGHTFGESGVSLLRRVVLPAALPGILTGLELGWSIAFRCLVAGEIFSGTLSGTGIGAVISRSKTTHDITEMLATIIVVLVMSVLVDRLAFARVQHRLRQTRGLVDSGLLH